MHDDHDEDVRGERGGDVEEAEEGALVAAAAARARRPVWHYADGVEEHDGDGGGEPGDEQHELLR